MGSRRHNARWLVLGASLWGLVGTGACQGGSIRGLAPDVGGRPGPGGRIAGHVTVRGRLPDVEPIHMGADPTCLELSGATPAGDDLVVADDGSVANAFVYISAGLPPSPDSWAEADPAGGDPAGADSAGFNPGEPGGGANTAGSDPAGSDPAGPGLPASAPPVASAPVVLDQRGCRFVPHVLGVQTGQPVAFVNSDPTEHDIHGAPGPNGEFNRLQPLQGMRESHVFDEPDVMALITCDRHPWMRAYVGVVPHPFFAVTDTGGTFTLQGVPDGRYTVTLWHERFGRLTHDAVVADHGTTRADFQFEVN